MTARWFIVLLYKIGISIVRLWFVLSLFGKKCSVKKFITSWSTQKYSTCLGKMPSFYKTGVIVYDFLKFFLSVSDSLCDIQLTSITISIFVISAGSHKQKADISSNFHTLLQFSNKTFTHSLTTIDFGSGPEKKTWLK